MSCERVQGVLAERQQERLQDVVQPAPPPGEAQVKEREEDGGGHQASRTEVCLGKQVQLDPGRQRVPNRPQARQRVRQPLRRQPQQHVGPDHGDDAQPCQQVQAQLAALRQGGQAVLLVAQGQGAEEEQLPGRESEEIVARDRPRDGRVLREELVEQPQQPGDEQQDARVAAFHQQQRQGHERQQQGVEQHRVGQVVGLVQGQHADDEIQRPRQVQTLGPGQLEKL